MRERVALELGSRLPLAEVRASAVGLGRSSLVAGTVGRTVGHEGWRVGGALKVGAVGRQEPVPVAHKCQAARWNEPT